MVINQTRDTINNQAENMIQSEKFIYEDNLTICILYLEGGNKVIGTSIRFGDEDPNTVNIDQRNIAKNDALKKLADFSTFYNLLRWNRMMN